MVIRTAAHIAGATAMLATIATLGHASMVQRMSLEEVTHEAAQIVHATVRQVRVGRDESGLPATWVTLDVTQTMKGHAGSQLTIKQYGVDTPLPDGTITRVAGLPRYHVGEEVVLFLRGPSRRGFTSPVGFAQGAYRVRRSRNAAWVRRDLSTDGMQSLDDFLAELGRLAMPAP